MSWSRDHGRIEVHTEFYDPVVIGESELIYIHSSMGHAYLVADGCDEPLTLGVCLADDDALAGYGLRPLRSQRCAPPRRVSISVLQLRPSMTSLGWLKGEADPRSLADSGLRKLP